MMNPFGPPPDPTDGPPYTHTLSAHGPWVECERCNGEGGIVVDHGADIAICIECHGEGGWEEPLPPPSYTITDLEGQP